MPRQPKARNWCFTLNNPGDVRPTFEDWATYLVYQLEEGENGTPHLQGYVQTSQKTLPFMKQWLPRAHFEPAKGTADDNTKYCTKEPRLDGPWTEGEPRRQGKRSDCDTVRDYLMDAKRSRRDIIDNVPQAFDRFPRLLDAIQDEHSALGPMEADLRPWQEMALSRTLEQNDRNILWIYDVQGNKGKSFLSRYLVRNHGAILVAGNDRDISHAYNGERIVVVDIPRTGGTDAPYATLENLKNGLLFSGKYNSRMRLFEPPAVICFANFPLPEGRWSDDRAVIINISEQD